MKGDLAMRMLALGVGAAAIFGLATFHAANAATNDVRFRVVNNSNRTIVDVRASNIDIDQYGPDLLGDYVVRTNQYMVVEPRNPGNYCRFDIRIEFNNGDVQEIRDVNLCRTRELATWGWNHNRFYHEVRYI
jgi:hypothetical protein